MDNLKPKTHNLKPSASGQSLVEVLVAVALGAIFIIAAGTIIAPALKVGTEAAKIRTGTALAKELFDNVRVWSEGDWHGIFNLAAGSANRYYLNTSISPFTSVSGEEQVTISPVTYTRFFYVEDVFRDAGGAIVTSGGTYDPSTRKVTVVYRWVPANAVHTLVGYATRYRHNIFEQTDWSGGSGQEGPVTSVNTRFSNSSNIDAAAIIGSIIIRFP